LRRCCGGAEPKERSKRQAMKRLTEREIMSVKRCKAQEVQGCIREKRAAGADARMLEVEEPPEEMGRLTRLQSLAFAAWADCKCCRNR
jgi:hypothetical protein